MVLLLINLKADKMEIYINHIIIKILHSNIINIYVQGFYKRQF